MAQLLLGRIALMSWLALTPGLLIQALIFGICPVWILLGKTLLTTLLQAAFVHGGPHRVVCIRVAVILLLAMARFVSLMKTQALFPLNN